MKDINFNIYKSINICSYEVNNDGTKPFLKFLLTKDNYFENLMMPYIPVYTDLDTEQAYNYVKIYLFALPTRSISRNAGSSS